MPYASCLASEGVVECCSVVSACLLFCLIAALLVPALLQLSLSAVLASAASFVQCIFAMHFGIACLGL